MRGPNLFSLAATLTAVIAIACSTANDEWTRQFGTDFPDFAQSVAVDNEGNAYVVGQALGALPGQTNVRAGFLRKYGRTGEELWTRQFHSDIFMRATGVAVDSEGNAYVAGRVRGALPGQTSAGGETDAVLLKYGPTGEELWPRQFGTDGEEGAENVAVDSQDNAYVVGFTNKAFPGQTHAGEGDAFIRKYGPTGEELWTRQFGTDAPEVAEGVAVDSEGNAYVVGSANGALPGQAGAGGRDAVLRKYGQAGEELWTRQFGTDGLDSAAGVAVDSLDNVYVGGFTDGALQGQAIASEGDSYLRKYNSTGEELWTRQFGSQDDDRAMDMAVDSKGNIYLAGDTDGILPSQTSAGRSDAFIRKFVPTN
jgi:hypothetical protein